MLKYRPHLLSLTVIWTAPGKLLFSVTFYKLPTSMDSLRLISEGNDCNDDDGNDDGNDENGNDDDGNDDADDNYCSAGLIACDKCCR